MIQPNELRLGNYVSQLGAVCQVVAVSAKINDSVYISQLGDTRSEGFTPESIDPIPLSDEWLAKFGFDDDGFRQYTLLNWGVKVVESLASKGSWIIYQGFLRQFQEIAEVQYIHQLQNLYFALTGEELKLNEL